jgi:hypothetical protein
MELFELTFFSLILIVGIAAFSLIVIFIKMLYSKHFRLI